MSDPMFETAPVALPYAGTTGYSGSDASRDMARDEAESGVAADRQSRVLNAARKAGPVGVTITEFDAKPGEHHGKVSSTFSVLHKAGSLARLTEKRLGNSIYVLPEHVNGRRTATQGRRAVPVGGQPDSLREATNRLAEAQAEIERLSRQAPKARSIAEDDAEFARVVRAAVAPQPVDGTFVIRTATVNRLLDIIDGLTREV